MNKLIFVITALWYLLSANTSFAYSHQDTLRGSNGIGRYWWDVQHYDLHVDFDTANKSISGYNTISFKITDTPHDSLQLDLQDLMFMDSIVLNGAHVPFSKDGNAWWVKYPFSKLPVNSTQTLTAYYRGKPHAAVRPPWDGGFIWGRDSMGKPWIAVACQGFGASCWWPLKDYQGDEPDNGMNLSFIVPTGLTCVSNGSLINKEPVNNGADIRWDWKVVNPINSYDATFYIGDYAHWHETLEGEKGKLDLDFYPLSYNLEKAKKQFSVANQMLQCFEHWMGPYPFYEDGYKLVEAPYLGMEHQSAVAYGNDYKMGYMGHDRSKAGWGMKFDFIIVHESGHEWFGNNITAKDITENWLHEGFTTYTEGLFAECLLGKEKAYEYIRGEWTNIENDRPVIGDLGVNDEGTSDKYDKGSAVIHMVRTMMNDDEQFRQMLRGMNQTFYHKIITSQQMEQYISKFSGIDFTLLFSQYLRTNMIPTLEYTFEGNALKYRFTNIIPGFTLPISVEGGKIKTVLHPTADWKFLKWKGKKDPHFSKDYLIKINS